jgi:hypothetical protein
LIADGVLHVLGLFVDLVPRKPQRLDEKQLDQAVSPQHPHRQCAALFGERGPFIRRVASELTFRERLQHARHGAGGNIEFLGELPGRNDLIPAPLADLQDRLEIVLDRQARHRVLSVLSGRGDAPRRDESEVRRL